MKIDALTCSNYYDSQQTTFGDRLSGAREMCGLSQGDLSKRLGVSVETVKVWELDQEEPASNQLQKIAGLLNVSIGWLLAGQGEGVSEPSGVTGEEVIAGALVREVVALRSDLRADATRLDSVVAHLERLLRRAQKDGTDDLDPRY